MTQAFNHADIEQFINQMLIEMLEVSEEEVQPQALLKDDLGADSMDNVEIVMQMERHFGINITDYQLEHLRESTVKDLYDMVEEAMK